MEGPGNPRGGGSLIGMSKLVAVIAVASLFTGGAIVALTNGAGPRGGSDYGLDTDGDGAYDWLVVKMGLRVDEADHYTVWATLGTETPFGRGCSGTIPPPMGNERGLPDGSFLHSISWTSVREFLEPGEHTIALAFRGTDLGFAGVDGPYVVQAQVYADGDWNDIGARGAPVPGPSGDGWTWEYETQAYDADAFEDPRWAIRFTGRHEDLGLDLDGDGLFEYLALRAEVDVTLAGTYLFDGYLSSTEGTRPDSWGFATGTYGTVDLEAGVQTIEARFNGGDLWASGVSGAFDFSYNVYYAGDWWGGGIREGEPYPPGPDPNGGEFDVYGDSLCGRTAEYDHGQWEVRVEPAEFTGRFADRGEDVDGDGLFDVLAVDAEVDVREANTFDFSGQLMSEDGAVWIAYAYEQAYLEVGVHTLTLRFSGPEIRRSGIDGPYRVDMNLVVAMRDPQTTYTTGSYAHTDFDEEETTTRGMYWIAELRADASTIAVTVQRGDDMLTVVLEDVLIVEAFTRDGVAEFRAEGKVYLPSGGSAQSFTFSWAPAPGTYIVRATLGDPAQPVDVVEIVVTV